MEDNAESISVVFTMRTLKKQKEKKERDVSKYRLYEEHNRFMESALGLWRSGLTCIKWLLKETEEYKNNYSFKNKGR